MSPRQRQIRLLLLGRQCDDQLRGVPKTKALARDRLGFRAEQVRVGAGKMLVHGLESGAPSCCVSALLDGTAHDRLAR